MDPRPKLANLDAYTSKVVPETETWTHLIQLRHHIHLVSDWALSKLKPFQDDEWLEIIDI